MTLAESEVQEPLALTRRHTVVLVDDQQAVLDALRRTLRREPYDVRTTTSAAAALDWISSGQVSLVILDQRMPGMCGTELADQVRRISPHTIRVMLTAYPGNALVLHGLDEEIQWLMSKPWNDDALRLTIRRLLRDLESSPPPSLPPPRNDELPLKGQTRCVEEGGIGLVWTRLGRAFRRATGAIVRGTRWILGFLWMADAGGSRGP